MKKVYLIHHTHWDYEWYFTENESKIQLNYHVKELLNYIQHQNISNYHLDGQTSIIDSFLKDNPDYYDKLKTQITNNNIWTGPWYTQSDQFLVRGVSINKNLELGLKKMRELGGDVSYAYVPDAFGQHPDLIDLYHENNLYNLVFWRGVDPSKITRTRFIWQKGSKQITAINLPYGYYYGYLLDDYESLLEFIQKYERDFPEDEIIVPIGGDQRAVDYQINQIVAKYNNNQSDYQFIVSNYEELFKLKPRTKLPVYQGEMLNGARSKIHRSIYSTRADHKILNNKCENLLIHQVNPLMLMAQKIGINHEEKLLENIWMELLKNHAHDSIGGCNSDVTNYHITHRYLVVIEQLESIIDYLVRKISESNAQDNQLYLFNTLSFSRKVEQELVISTATPSFTINENESQIRYNIVEQKRVYHGSLTEDIFDEKQFHYETTIKLTVEMGAYSIKKLQINEDDKVNVELKKVGNHHQLLKKFNIVFTPDAGDGYDYSDLDENYIIEYRAEQAKQIGLNTYEIQVKLPKNLTGWKDRKKLENHTIKIEINHEEELDKFKISFINKVKEFRLQIKWNQELGNNYHFADGPLFFNKRYNIDENIDNWQENNWCEEPTSIYPMISVVNFDTKHNLITNGTKEYEIKEKHLYLTLMRSVSYLGKPSLKRRPGKASGQEYKWVPTPDNEMKGEYEFEFAYYQEHDLSQVKRKVICYQNRINYYQIQSLNRFTGRLKYFTSNQNQLLDVKLDTNLLKIDLPQSLVLMGIEPKNNGYQLQVVNYGQTPVEFKNKVIESGMYKKIYLEEL